MPIGESTIAVRSFKDRLRRAADNIVHGRTEGRELDEAFENGDGDAMCAALYTLAKENPRLQAALERHAIGASCTGWQWIVGAPMPLIESLAKAHRLLCDATWEVQQAVRDAKAEGGAA